MNTWYSTDNETFDHSEIDEAAEYLFNYDRVKVGDVGKIYSGEFKTPLASDFMPENIVESISECAYDLHGERSGDWPETSRFSEDELLKSLKEVVDAWADKHKLHPTFFVAKNIQTIHVKLLNDDGGFEIVTGEHE